MSTYFCRYCGKEKDFEDRDYDIGLALAERASMDALMHIEGVTPYLICKACADDIRCEMKGEQE